MSTVVLNIIENIALFLVFVVAFWQLTKRRWRGARPSAGEELNFDRKQIKEIIDVYLEKPIQPKPQEEPKPEAEPQNVVVPKPVQVILPKTATKKKIITTRQNPALPAPFRFDIKNAILYEIIFKRKNQNGIDDRADY